MIGFFGGMIDRRSVPASAVDWTVWLDVDMVCVGVLAGSRYRHKF
jgi:hypothetical protein